MGRDASVTDRAYQALRHDLLACRLPPGQRINISRIQRDTGFSQIIIDPDPNNIRAVRAYEKAGFRPIAELAGKTGDSLIMRHVASSVSG